MTNTERGSYGGYQRAVWPVSGNNLSFSMTKFSYGLVLTWSEIKPFYLSILCPQKKGQR